MQRPAGGGACKPPFFSRSPSAARAAREDEEGPRHKSPGRMAVPPGSSLPALRVRSSRGPIVRGAPRGARSGWMRHATGLTRLSEVTTGINDCPCPWKPGQSPPISRPDRLPLAVPTRKPAHVTNCVIQDRHLRKSRKCLISFGLRDSVWTRCGASSHCGGGILGCSSTKCGNVNPHGG